MTSQQIQYVLMIAEEKSFSKAARRLYTTQPSLSRFVIALEEQLGYKLFDRNVTPLALTDEGKLFVEAACQIRQIERGLSEKINKLRREDQKPLRLGITPFRASYYLPRILGYFHKKYPSVKIELCERPMVYLKERLLGGELDLAVGPGPVKEPSLAWVSLPNDYVYFALSPDRSIRDEWRPFLITVEEMENGMAKNKPYMDLSVFCCEKFINYHSDAALSRCLPEICRQYGFEPQVILSVRNFSTALMLVQAGVGCALTFETVIRTVRFDRPPYYFRLNLPSWPVAAVYRKAEPLTFIQQEFVRILQALK